MLGSTRALIVDEDTVVVEHVSGILAERCGARALWARTLRRAHGILAHDRIDVIVTETKLPDERGKAVVRALRRASPSPIVVLTAHGDEALAAQSIASGAAAYVVKRHGFQAELGRTLDELLGWDLCRRVARLPSPAAVASYSGTGVVGTSNDVLHSLWLASRAARSRAAVLIEGETGTGKELIARTIHDLGPNSSAPFRVQNCAAVPESLLEAELFGHVRGSFTSADRDRAGLFLDARNGTVFLDEIGDASPSLQARLLRVLQEGEVKPVGADRPQQSQARVIAATHRRLDHLVQHGAFRRDLYYRLAVFPIFIAPLRERPDDIPPLVDHFRGRFQAEENRELGGLTSDALEALQAYAWPGNVRELAHEVHRLVLTQPQGVPIDANALAPHIRASTTGLHGEPLDQIIRRVELAVLRDRIRRMPSKAAAARSLGITREALYWKLRRLEGADPEAADSTPRSGTT